MELKKVQKSSTEALRSSKDDLKINKRKCSQNHEKLLKIIDYSRSEGQVGAQICIEKALGITC